MTNEIQILFKTVFTSKTDKKNIYLLSAALAKLNLCQRTVLVPKWRSLVP
ncbi:hypothetical protein CRENPOLYSF1_90091 [Crenothrix polyspora]|uniref:Uncharacterized protein n=1 Tax=Crenothrix polyspora TaxID=360316 RepID=A0A1R4HJT5_9GAMM|nr:hypothetical protein CRENPOLYSF1_90091 [Crenothrix polyspora]